tara:strand:+ start:1430 stop:1609 length:180 start_codon:yes stop_codon:yes gene_type:complete
MTYRTLEKALEFKIKDVNYKQVGVKRDDKGNFNLVLIKNLDKRTFKYIQRATLEKILNK